MAGRPKRTEEVTSLLLRLPPTLLRKLDRCKAILELREGGSLTRTSVLSRALDVGADVLIGEDTDQYGQPVEMQPENMRQSIPEHKEIQIVPEDPLEEALEEDERQSQNSVPDYDTSKYALGRLCPSGHDYHGTGKTLLRLPKYVCPPCDAARARERRQAKRETAQIALGSS